MNLLKKEQFTIISDCGYKDFKPTICSFKIYFYQISMYILLRLKQQYYKAYYKKQTPISYSSETPFLAFSFDIYFHVPCCMLIMLILDFYFEDLSTDLLK